MKAMPDIIQNIQRKAQKEKEHKEAVNAFFLSADCRIRKVERQNKETETSGINIRPML